VIPAVHPGTSPRAGFTLLEMVVTIAILGILGAAVAVFLQRPVQEYVDTTRRAQLVQTADFALRRIARDLAASAPNSTRSAASGGDKFLEMLLVQSGGRYCNAADCGNPLLDADRTFTVVGPMPAVSAGQSIVIGNLPGSGPPGATCDAYPNGAPNRRTIQSFTASSITFQEASGFSSSCAETTKRFQIVSGSVSYACQAATNTLWRYAYAIQSGQPASIAALNGLATAAALATKVNCAGTNFNTAYAGDGLVELQLQLQSSGESVQLYRQVKVDNTP
jgi:MSHA biogenesis protein MshO